jgi:hypothetical protein
MNATRSFLLTITAASLALASAGTARAAENSDAPTRAEVKALVLQASAEGRLMPAGEVPFPFTVARGTAERADVKAATRQAAADGTLMAAGDVPIPSVVARSLRARADVKAETMQARSHGDLVPAGERMSVYEPGSEPRLAQRRAGELTAAARR